MLVNDKNGSKRSWKRLGTGRFTSFDKLMSISGKRKVLINEKAELSSTLESIMKRIKVRKPNPTPKILMIVWIMILV